MKIPIAGVPYAMYITVNDFNLFLKATRMEHPQQKQ